MTNNSPNSLLQAESSIAKLRKKEGELEVAAQKGDGAKAEEEDTKEPRHHSIAQIIYAENRVRVRGDEEGVYGCGKWVMKKQERKEDWE